MSVRFLADADLNYAIVRGVRRREPAVDFKSANEAGLEGLPDFDVLEVAARQGRILITHDASTMPVHFAIRTRQGLKNPGVLLAFQSTPVGKIIESILTIWSTSDISEWSDQIHYLPSLTRHPLR